MVDELPFGGTCVLRGCDPKKVLRRGAEIVDAARLLRNKGVSEGGLRIDWPSLIAFKRSFTDPVPAQREQSLAQNGIAALKGKARFIDKTKIAVGDDVLSARYVLIASGAKPVPLDIPGAEHVTTSDEFLEIERLPKRILFIGGGYVSFEFAHFAARADSEITMLDRGERPLNVFDPDLVDMLVTRTRTLGIDFRPDSSVTTIEKSPKGLVVTASVGGEPQRFDADLVVHGAGRVPAVDGMDLEQGGVRAGTKGVEVNEYLQSTSNSAVYAAGDVAATAGPPLTPVAGIEGRVAARNMLEGNREKPNYHGVPSAVFTIPALARVGLLEAEARERGLDVDCKFSDMSGWYSVRRVGEPFAAAKVLVDKTSKHIVGAHLLGPESTELINFFGLAMRLGIPASDLKEMISAYPSAGSDLGYLI
jgi:glutathione reductase (NADPH)